MSSTYYFIEPFAGAGDTLTIPVASQADGSISFTDGFGIDYELDPGTNPAALDVPRQQTNQLFFLVTQAIQQYQQFGFPNFISTSDNGGSPFPYSQNAVVQYDPGTGLQYYFSLVSSNTALPTDTTKWGILQYNMATFVTGDIMMWPLNTIRSGGWAWLNGTTIGSASSGSTGRANADTSNLFAALWTDWPNAVLPIQNSDGSSGTRGISAAADFTANKRLPVPDLRGRAFFGLDNMGGASTAGRITTGGSGISGTTLGSSGGSETVSLSGNQNGTHTHSGTTDSAGSHTHFTTVGFDPTNAYVTLTNNNSLYGVNNPSSDPLLSAGSNNSIPNVGLTNIAGTHMHNLTNNNSGLGSAHQNMTPAIIAGGFIIKL